MTSNQLKDMQEDLSKNCCKCCKCTSDFISNYPVLSTLIGSGIILSATTLVCPKSRKILFPVIKYLGKQQMKLFTGIGILSVATYIANNVNNDDIDVTNLNNEEIILDNLTK